jgi:hypothetical protein
VNGRPDAGHFAVRLKARAVAALKSDGPGVMSRSLPSRRRNRPVSREACKTSTPGSNPGGASNLS